MDLREIWEKADSPPQKSIAALRDLLGLPVAIQLDFTILWSELQKYYPDQNTFVPSITAVVETWTDCLARRLADDANAAWTEQLLEHVNRSGRTLKARVEVSTAVWPSRYLKMFSCILWPILNDLIRHDRALKSRPSSRSLEQHSLSASPSHHRHTETCPRSS